MFKQAVSDMEDSPLNISKYFILVITSTKSAGLVQNGPYHHLIENYLVLDILISYIHHYHHLPTSSVKVSKNKVIFNEMMIRSVLY
jgi:hypothetical protein